MVDTIDGGAKERPGETDQVQDPGIRPGGRKVGWLKGVDFCMIFLGRSQM